jgi:dolichyl-phosphate beta-glucosyltransferase
MTQEGAPLLSVVVPAYNEASRIAGSLERIAGFLSTLEGDSELIIVDDGSDEAGRKAVEDAVAVLRAGQTRHLLRHERNRGKGAAVRTGCLAARGRYVAFLDADLATPPESLGDLLGVLERGADVAVGVRRQADGSDMRNRRSLKRRLAGRLFSAAVSTILLPGLSDSQCPLKAFRGDVARALFPMQRIDSWSFDAEILYLARRMGLERVEVPVSWLDMDGSHVKLTRSFGELWNLFRIRWMHRGVKRSSK